MAGCLMAPSHYLNQHLLISKFLGCCPRSNFIVIAQFYHSCLWHKNTADSLYPETLCNHFSKQGTSLNVFNCKPYLVAPNDACTCIYIYIYINKKDFQTKKRNVLMKFNNIVHCIVRTGTFNITFHTITNNYQYWLWHNTCIHSLTQNPA